VPDSTTMTAWAEHDSGTAARILAAARELALKRGVKGLTIAEIAEKAHVGKGTAYLYWKTKDELLLGLFARDFLTLVDDEIEALTADPELVRPHRLCPLLVRSFPDHPFVRALHTGDDDLLGALAQHPRATELLDRLGPTALLGKALPVWRRYQLVRTDWPPDEQAYALQALLTGFLETATRTAVLRGVTVDAPDNVMAAAVTALLGPENASPAELRATAGEGLQLLRERRNTALALIIPNQEPKH
jgi:AcrR family transcriptional regulator